MKLDVKVSQRSISVQGLTTYRLPSTQRSGDNCTICTQPVDYVLYTAHPMLHNEFELHQRAWLWNIRQVVDRSYPKLSSPGTPATILENFCFEQTHVSSPFR
jgi:hypothetical protein